MNKFAVITGATKGIGKAIALKFAKEGFFLALCARGEEGLSKISAEIKSINADLKFFTQSVDVSKKNEISEFAKAILKKGTPDVLVNNAGAFFTGTFFEEPENQLEKHIETNLYAAYNLTRALAPKMILQKSGHIFNICSVASKKVFPTAASYCISKYAMYGMNTAMRQELMPHNIKVTAVLPGATLTNSWQGVKIDPKRIMEADDVAQSIWSAYNLAAQTCVEELIIRPQLGDL